MSHSSGKHIRLTLGVKIAVSSSFSPLFIGDQSFTEAHIIGDKRFGILNCWFNTNSLNTLRPQTDSDALQCRQFDGPGGGAIENQLVLPGR